MSLPCNKKTITQVCLFLIFVLMMYLVVHFLYGLFVFKEEPEVSFLIFSATAALAWIAWYEFNRSNSLANNEFLLFISNRWGGSEILKARKIIHELFVSAYRTKNSKTKNDYDHSLVAISEAILEMRKENGEKGEQFAYLLNLIDYLEVLSYFHNRGNLGIDEIRNTSGNNVIFFYEIFKLYKEHRQRHDKSQFCNFDQLYNKLKSGESVSSGSC
jgi:hypothetical protein